MGNKNQTPDQPGMFRVYANIVIEAAFDIHADNAKDARKKLLALQPGMDIYPAYLHEDEFTISKILGAVASGHVHGVTHAENLAEIERLKAENLRLAAENKAYAKEEARQLADQDDEDEDADSEDRG